MDYDAVEPICRARSFFILYREQKCLSRFRPAEFHTAAQKLTELIMTYIAAPATRDDEVTLAMPGVYLCFTVYAARISL